jgi:hypothetical protein
MRSSWGAPEPVPGIAKLMRSTMLTDMTFTFSHDRVGITVTPEDLDATIAWYSHNLGFAVDQRFESLPQPAPEPQPLPAADTANRRAHWHPRHLPRFGRLGSGSGWRVSTLLI